MSRDISSFGFVRRNSLRNMRSEGNENEHEKPTDSILFPPHRSPLNSIPDPSQYARGIEECDPDSITKLGSSKVGGSSDGRIEAFDYRLALSKGITNTGLNSGTHRNARGKAHSEPNSAQSTPARSVPKVFNSAVLSGCTGTRTPQYTGARGGTSSRVPRGISIVSFAPYTEVPYFELVEDPSFWMDHNVQVLIRIRPLSTTERALQGYGRCLRQDSEQTLTWLGHPETRFTFDHIACETISQEKLFKVVGLPMVENCMSGYNSCMFAYGQTGSGKTYTMMGEINQMDGKLNEYCGLTPRIFEYLFIRIRAEEENRRDENLKYSCKCSFLEIYNEQITDLLEPSSTNLQLREDMKKGVYVENLTEYEVITVRDVVELLLQGAANRKMAATHMNSESSRSHSVFTCVIESRWDKDSMNHLRFGRLNLVDLAGSERQKSSGAEGERLKEAANINKSLSTLGLVIMTLVDVAQGKHRHVPYRDSRLTFLLQDSLGGNSKTTIIANVSASMCSANETLSTLKFAQRAKLIQNNAKVNEDASGDVVALQQEIQQLKGQLTFLLKHHNLSSSPLLGCPRSEQSNSIDSHKECDSSFEVKPLDDKNAGVPERKKIFLEAALAGALRREKIAETAVSKLEAEIENMNRLVHQREEDAQCAKMMLRLNGEKIKRLELLADDLVSGDQYLMEENSALSKKIQLLQARIDRNPELTRFALENMRLLHQLRVLQDYYEQGERESLLAEVSEMRDQLLEALERNHDPFEFCQRTVVQDTDTLKELEECRKNLSASIKCNKELTSKVDELQRELKKYLECDNAASHSVVDSLCGEDSIKHTDKYSRVDIMSMTSDSEHDTTSNYQVAYESMGLQKDQEFGDVLAWASTVTQKELRDEGPLIETMKSEQVRLVEELDILRQGHSQYMELSNNKDRKDIKFPLKVGNHCELLEGCQETEVLGHQDTGHMTEGIGGFTRLVQQDKFDRMQRELEEARILNMRYKDDKASQLSNQHEAEQIRKQVEMETAETILHLQEELATFEERLYSLTQENTSLRKSVVCREDAIKALSEEWEKATLDLTGFLLEGCKSLEDASNHIESISMSFPQKIIGEQAQRAAKVFVEKEKTILFLGKSLEEAQKIGQEMKSKLSSLKGATLAITEVQQLENDQSTKEATQLRRLLNEKNSLIQELEKKLKNNEEHIIEAVTCADAAFIIEKRLLDFQNDAHRNDSEQEIRELATQGDMYMVPEMKDKANIQALEAIELQVEMTRQRVLEAESAIYASYIDTQIHLSSLLSDSLKSSTIFLRLIQDLAEEIRTMKNNIVELKEQNRVSRSYMMGSRSLVAFRSQMLENKYPIVKEIKDELGQANKTLNALKTGIGKLLNVCGSLGKVEDLPATDVSSIDSFQFSSDTCPSRISFMGELDETSSSNSCCVCPVEFHGLEWDSISERCASFMLKKGKLGDFQKPIEKLVGDDAAIQSLKKDLQLAFNSFLEIHVHLATFFDYKEIACCPYVQGRCFHESITFGNNNHYHTDQKVHDKLDVMETGQQLQSIEDDTANFSKNGKILDFKLSNPRLVTEEGNRVNSFLNKCEEAQATMKEADAMLNALLKANEAAKHKTDEWKQAGEKLMIERATLVEEVQQLKASLFLKEEEYEIMQDQMVEVTSSLSFLEGAFFQMQRDVEDWFKVIISDIISLGQDIWDHLHNSRSSLEEICSSMIENGFALFVQYQCHVGKHFGKIPTLNADLGLFPYRQGECCSTLNSLDTKCMNTGEDSSVIKGILHLKGMLEQSQNKNPKEELSQLANTQDAIYSCRAVAKWKEDELSQSFESLISENLSLKRELSRKDVILKGLLFDLSLLQESAASANDTKTEMEQIVAALIHVRHELAVKATQLDNILIQHQKLRAELDDRIAAVSISNSELEQAKATVYTLSNQNTELRLLLEDLYVRKNSTEQQLEEKNEAVKCLEKEIIRLVSSTEEKILTSIVDIENDLRTVTAERDCLFEEVITLNGKLELANALAEENEAIAIEARQESEASKIYAEQKEEEVKILEHSVGELECTVDMLEKKVYEMSKEVSKHHIMRDDLELELQALRQRMSTVETAAENMDSGNSNVEDQEEDETSKHRDSRTMERIRFLEKEKADQAEEIKRCKEYISELVLHTEAQATQYQQKYKALEYMVREIKSDPSTSTSAALTLDKSEKAATRTRGSGSPFRCIVSLVQQMDSEKDQELSMAKLRIEELETLAAKRHKEVCMLNARLSAAENMTHDVIRDLLGVKLDMTNFANLIDQDQIQKLLEEVHRQKEESLAMEQEILKLQEKINDLTAERESCIDEINEREADVLAAQLTVEQLQQRDQLLAVQNEMLQMENTILKRKGADLDEMLKEVLGSQNIHQCIQQPPKMTEQNLVRVGNRELSKRLAHSQKVLSHVNDELAWYSKSERSDPNSKGKEVQRQK